MTRLIATSRGHQTMQQNLIPDPKNQKLVSMRMIKLNATKDKGKYGGRSNIKMNLGRGRSIQRPIRQIAHGSCDLSIIIKKEVKTYFEHVHYR